jgi:hypothetical protein
MMLVTQSQEWIQRAQKHVADSLGLELVPTGQWDKSSTLPFHLKGGWEFLSAMLDDGNVLLLLDTETGSAQPSRIQSRVEQIRQKAGMPVIYIREHLPSYMRLRLIQARVPFIVAGSHLYLPVWGIDFKTMSKRQASRHKSEFLSPAAQSLLIRMIRFVCPPSDFTLDDVRRDEPYSIMTVSRAVREWSTFGIVEIQKQGRQLSIRFPMSFQQTWEHAKSRMRSPVVDRVWVIPTHSSECKSYPDAGETALSRETLLGDPTVRVCAVSHGDWVKRRDEMMVIPFPDQGAVQVEIWSYEPKIRIQDPSVDPLSLILSMQDHADERVQDALDRFEKGLIW